jgi:hypothetical protein
MLLRLVLSLGEPESDGDCQWGCQWRRPRSPGGLGSVPVEARRRLGCQGVGPGVGVGVGAHCQWHWQDGPGARPLGPASAHPASTFNGKRPGPASEVRPRPCQWPGRPAIERGPRAGAGAGAQQTNGRSSARWPSTRGAPCLVRPPSQWAASGPVAGNGAATEWPHRHHD